ncbi:MAG TPA: ABC transporter permease [Candidatus Saccharimonadales bacterium]|nr:ABC transporter permease [Candidatus Saccharimonadales bacterium]
MMRGNVRMALSGVRSAKWRSILTMTGVIVGIVAVVTVVGIGEGVKRQVSNQLDHFGTDLITVRPGQTAKNNSLMGAGNTDVIFGMGSVSGLTNNDVEVIEHAGGARAVAPLGVVTGSVQVDSKTFNDVPVLAANRYLPEALNQKVAFGDFWGEKNETAATAVIGKDVAADLFEENVPLGRTFTLRGQTFVVRGVFDGFDSVPFSPTGNFDHSIFIPYQTAAALTHNDAGLYTVLVKPDDPNNIASTVKGITANLREAHGGQQDFMVLGPHQTMETGSHVLKLLTTWIVAVAAISLFIGGVGIMNTMLLSVTERMHEIGVRKAIGATSRQILGQFVLEATVLSVVGGVIGIALALAVDGLLYTYSDLKPVISWNAIGIAFGVSLAVGIIFGAAPAIKASRKDPIEALRHE